MLRRVLPLVVMFWPSTPMLAQVVSVAEDSAVRLVLEKFFAAYREKDLDMLVALWSEKSPDVAVHKQALRQQFATEDISLDNLTTSLLSKQEQRGPLSGYCRPDSHKSKDRSQALGASGSHAIDLVREGQNWKVSRYLSPADDLVDNLLSLPDDADRRRELTRKPELVTPQLVQILINRGLQLLQQGNTSQAESLYFLAKTVSESIGDKSGTGDALIHIASLLYSQGRYDSAVDKCMAAMSLYSTINNNLGMARALYHLGSIYWRQSRHSEAWDQLKRSHALSESLGDRTLTAQTLNAMGIVRARQSDYVSALELYRNSLSISQSDGDTVGVARSFVNMGILHLDKGDYTLALETYQKALDAFEALGNKRGLLATLVNIGTIHSEQGNYSRASEFFRQSLAISEPLGDKLTISGTLNSLGTVFSRRHDLAEH